jgi:hypothetical protein
VRRLGDEDAPEAGGLGRLGVVVEVQLVHRLEVEGEAAVRAVHLDADRVLAAAGEAGRLERADRAVAEARGEQRGVVDRDRTGLGRAARREPRRPRRQGPLLHEGLGEAGDTADDRTDEVLGQVDDVGADVPERPRPRLVLLQPPDERELRVDDPVLEVLGADVADRPEPSLLHELTGEGDGGNRR